MILLPPRDRTKARFRAYELARIRGGVDGASAAGRVPADVQSLVIYNPLSAPVYLAWRATPTPTTTDKDLAVPGLAMMTIPVIGEGAVDFTAAVFYPGVPLAADAADDVVFIGSQASLSATVGPLA